MPKEIEIAKGNWLQGYSDFFFVTGNKEIGFSFNRLPDSLKDKLMECKEGTLIFREDSDGK